MLILFWLLLLLALAWGLSDFQLSRRIEPPPPPPMVRPAPTLPPAGQPADAAPPESPPTPAAAGEEARPASGNGG